MVSVMLSTSRTMYAAVAHRCVRSNREVPTSCGSLCCTLNTGKNSSESMAQLCA